MAVNLQQIVVRRRMADSPKTGPSVLPTQAVQGIWLEVLAQSRMAEAGFALDCVAQTAQQVAAIQATLSCLPKKLVGQ